MLEKKNMIGKTIRDINEAVAVNEVINQENAETNAKIYAALTSTSRSRPENADLLDQLGIKYHRIDGSTGWVLTGPNGREITHRHATAKDRRYFGGVNKATNRKRNKDWRGQYRGWDTTADTTEDFKKIDYLTALTSPEVGKAGRQSQQGYYDRTPDQLDLYTDERYRFNDAKIDAKGRYSSISLDLPTSDAKRSSIYFSYDNAEKIRAMLNQALAELDGKLAEYRAAREKDGQKAVDLRKKIEKRTGFEVRPGEAKRVVKAAPTETAGFKHIKKKK